MLRRDSEFFRYVMFSNEVTFHNNGQQTDTSVIIGPLLDPH